MVVALFGVASFKSYNPIRWIRNTENHLSIDDCVKFFNVSK